MPGIREWINQQLLYQTPKVVRIRERGLRLLQFAFMGAIFIYCLIKVIIIDQAYFISEVPTGTVQVKFRKDKKLTNFREYSYCHGAYDGEDKWTDKFPVEKHPCRLWDSTQIEEKNKLNQIFIPTAMRDQVIKYKCGLENTPQEHENEFECEKSFPIDDNLNDIYFLTLTSDSSLQIVHQFQAPSFLRLSPNNREYSGYTGNYKGKLVDTKGKVIRQFQIGSDFDIIPIEEIYQAAGVSLSDEVIIGDRWSRRLTGMILSVSISYTNEKGSPSYTYKVKLYPQPGYNTAELLMTTIDWKADRRFVEQVGTLMLFHVDGKIDRFDFQNLLIQLFSASVLISLSSALTDFVMLSLLPMKHHYHRAKYEDTEDFEELRQRESSHKKELVEQWNMSLMEMRQSSVEREDTHPQIPKVDGILA